MFWGISVSLHSASEAIGIQPATLPTLCKGWGRRASGCSYLSSHGQVASFSFQSCKYGSSATHQGVVHLGHHSNSKTGVEVRTVSKGEFQSPGVLYSLPCPGRAEVASLFHEWEGKGMGSLADHPSMPWGSWCEVTLSGSRGQHELLPGSHSAKGTWQSLGLLATCQRLCLCTHGQLPVSFSVALKDQLCCLSFHYDDPNPGFGPVINNSSTLNDSNN